MKTKAVIVDVDGTIAHKGERDPYDMTTVSQDTPNWPVLTVVQALSDYGYQIIFTSGRDETARFATQEWIYDNTVLPQFVLYMRAEGDNRPDDEVKKEMWTNIIEPLYQVDIVIDDRNKVVKMWRSLGLTCLQVAEGNF